MKTELDKLQQLHRELADAYLAFAEALDKASVVPATATPAGPVMTDRMAWFARWGSVVKHVSERGSVDFSEFLKVARAAGYPGNTYGQLIRHDGLLHVDEQTNVVSLNKKAPHRLKEATDYLSKRGYTL